MPIFDQGYQHWTGELSGHTWRWLAIARHGVRAGMKSRLLSIAVKVAWMPALALAGVLCLWGLLERQSTIIAPIMKYLTFLSPQIRADPRHYRKEIWTLCYHWFLAIELMFSMILILMVGPNLISQDLRFNALPLYFSRPLRRIDYFLGKLGVIAWFLAMVMILPSLIAYILGLLFSLDISIIRDTFPILLASVAYGSIIAVSAGLLVLALSSLSRNSRYVALFWLGIWLVSSILGTILEGVERQQRFQRSYNRHIVNAQMNPTARMTPQQQLKLQREWQAAVQQGWEEAQAEAARAAKKDWRPLVSYTGNLARVGEQLLGTNKSWQSLGQLLPRAEREQFLFAVMGPQYPWHWSALVLAGIFGLSACILNFRVKSLDRLK